MRIASYILMAVGILLMASAGYDQYRGITSAPSSRYTGYSHYTISKQAKPEEFHNAIIVNLTRPFLILLVGVIAFFIDRGQEKVDPMGPDADENIDEELRKDELDREAVKEQAGKPPEG